MVVWTLPTWWRCIYQKSFIWCHIRLQQRQTEGKLQLSFWMSWSQLCGRTRFPRCLRGKESACNAGDLGSIDESGRSRGGGHVSPLQSSYLENPMDRGAWGASAHRVTELDTREATEPSPARGEGRTETDLVGSTCPRPFLPHIHIFPVSKWPQAPEWRLAESSGQWLQSGPSFTDSLLSVPRLRMLQYDRTAVFQQRWTVPSLCTSKTSLPENYFLVPSTIPKSYLYSESSVLHYYFSKFHHMIYVISKFVTPFFPIFYYCFLAWFLLWTNNSQRMIDFSPLKLLGLLLISWESTCIV